MTLKIITPPAVEPVLLAEAKLQARIDDDSEDALVSMWISAARQQAEHETGRPLITQTWERVLDAFPLDELDLGKPNVQSVASVTYIDENGVTQTLASDAYSLDAEGEPAFIMPAIGTSWPATLATANAVRVRFVCGYGADGSSVPAPIKAWMMLQIAAMHRTREAFAEGVSVQTLPGRFTAAMLDPFRVYL